MKMKMHEKHSKKKAQSERENDLRPMLVPTTLAVLGILSSCPRVMTMQCWKSQIPPPLSTRLRIVMDWFWPQPDMWPDSLDRIDPQKEVYRPL